MGLTKEEKERRREQRRQAKFEQTHKNINGIDHKICSECREWFPCTEKYFSKNAANGIDGFYPYCKPCNSKRTQKWQEENQEQYRATISKRDANPSPERIVYMREHSARNLKLGLQKQWQQSERGKQKLKEHREKRKQKDHRISEKEWLDCRNYFDDSCAYCGLHLSEHFNMFKGEMIHTDFHREHVDDEGANDLSNCVPACKSCNVKKYTFEFNNWYNENNPIYTQERYLKIIKWLSEDYKLYIKVK
jgi:hypothetical protein